MPPILKLDDIMSFGHLMLWISFDATSATTIAILGYKSDLCLTTDPNKTLTIRFLPPQPPRWNPSAPFL
jgi:hypothetical protein